MTTASVTYAGVKLPPWTRQADDWITLMGISPAEVYRFNDKPDLNVFDHLPFPPRVEPPPVRGGVLWWPLGASQFARVHYFCNAATLTAIRAALVALAGSSTAGYPPATLVIDDGAGGTFTGAMHFLPPLPLLGNAQAYLLTLVDERYWWWWKPGIDLSAVTTWTGMYSALGTGIGTTVTVDGSLTGFAAPSTRWNTFGNLSLPLLLDAAAWSTGRRIIRLPNGNVHATDYATAKTAAAAVRTAIPATYRKRAGGPAADADVRKNAPAEVVVRGGGTDQVVTLTSLAITDYSGVTGKSGYRATVNVDASTLSAPEAQTLSSEWYKWRLADEDASYTGTAGFDPCGWWGAVEWVCRTDEWATRTLPAPLPLGHSAGGAPDADVAASDPLYLSISPVNEVSLNVSAWTFICHLTIPRDGVYLVGYSMTGFLDHVANSRLTAGVFIGPVGIGGAAIGGGTISNWLEANGKSLESNAWSFPFKFSAGSVVSLVGAAIVPAGSGTPAAAYAIVPGSAHNPLPVSLVGNTELWVFQIAGTTGGVTPPPPPPPGSIAGHVGFTDGSNVAGRTVTLSGSSSATTTTDVRGNYSFTGVSNGSAISTLTLLTGESSTHSEDGSFYASGAAGTVTMASDAHNISFIVAPPSGVISGSVKNSLLIGLSARTITLSGANTATTTTDGSGNYTFGSLSNGSTTATLTLGGGESATHTVDGVGPTAGAAGTVTIAADSHTCNFNTTP